MVTILTIISFDNNALVETGTDRERDATATAKGELGLHELA